MIPDFNFKYYNELRLLLLIIGLYLLSEKLVNFIIGLLDSADIKYYRFYPATALLALVFSIINKYVHKIPWLWRLLMKVPLIRGTYIGKVAFNYNREYREKNCRFVVTQTSSKIKVDCYFWDEDKNGIVISETQTESESIVEDLLKKENGLHELLFYFRNKGNQDSTISIREGFNSLIYIKEKDLRRLEGTYFVKNGRSKGNGGKISVDYKTKELKHI